MKLPIGTYTLYNNFENCPFKAYRMYVLKDIPRVETPEMKWGNEVHSAFEDRIAKGTPLPSNMQQGEDLASKFSGLKALMPVQVEYKLAIDKNGHPIDYWNDWCWFRGKLDVAVLPPHIPDAEQAAWLVDWKTGKVREDPMELQTGSLLLKANYPELQIVVGEYFWLQTGEQGHRYTLTDWSAYFGRLQALRGEMEGYAASGTWPKRKNPLCGWCPVTDCEHNKSHKRK